MLASDRDWRRSSPQDRCDPVTEVRRCGRILGLEGALEQPLLQRGLDRDATGSEPCAASWQFRLQIRHHFPVGRQNEADHAFRILRHSGDKACAHCIAPTAPEAGIEQSARLRLSGILRCICVFARHMAVGPFYVLGCSAVPDLPSHVMAGVAIRGPSTDPVVLRLDVVVTFSLDFVEGEGREVAWDQTASGSPSVCSPSSASTGASIQPALTRAAMIMASASAREISNPSR